MAITITFMRERTITETFTVEVTPERLRELVAEHAPSHSDDIANSLTAYNEDDMAPVLDRIVVESGATSEETKTSDLIYVQGREDIADYICGDHAPDDHCKDCEQCPDDCTCAEDDDEEEEDDDDA
jgi:hypothetical protein